MSNKILKSIGIVELVSSLQKSLHKVRQKVNANTETLEVLNTRIEEQAGIATANDCQLADKIESNRVQAFQRSEQIAASLAQVKKENDDREMRQTVRDQNNIQALHNLKDSVQKAFDQVKTDVQSLMSADIRLRGEVVSLTNVAALLQNRVNAAPAQTLPAGHEWVNKKLSGVYSQLDEVEARLTAIETARRLEATEQLERRVEQLEKTPVAVSSGDVVGRNRARIVNEQDICTDTACKLKGFNSHLFGPGCRFYENGW